MKVELTRNFFFEAAHRNPKGGEAQQRVHGHSYHMEVVIVGEVASEYGWLVDYGDIKQAVQPVYDQVDHAYLNNVEGLDDTTLPALRRWLLERLQPHVAFLRDVRVSIVGDLAFRPVELAADATRNLPARWRFTFEAAQSLPQLPKQHQCHNLHGHSYRIEVAARDMLKLREELSGLYEVLDHRNLNEVSGLEGTTCEHLCEWVWNLLIKEEHVPTVVVVQETESARCVYYGE